MIFEKKNCGSICKSFKRETQNETPLLLVNTAQSIFKELFTALSKDCHDSGGMILVMAAATTLAPWDWSNTESEDSGVSCLSPKFVDLKGKIFLNAGLLQDS